MQIGDIFPLGRLIGAKGPLVLDSSTYTVVYFYPKDKTPGCTIEAGEFQKLKPAFDQAKIRIVGVSADDSASHADFCEAEGLSFELATDPKATLGNEMGIGNGGMHKRTTYVLNHDGEVVLLYEAVKPRGHAQEIFDAIARLR